MMKKTFKFHKSSQWVRFLVLCAMTVVMLYPLAWIVSASFKENTEIFNSMSLIPDNFSLDAFVEGWKGSGQYTFTTFYKNTFIIVVPSVIFTLISSTLAAYGFARFNFVFKKILFAIMIATLMLPETTLMIPRYMLFNELGWLNSYFPFWIPAMFATKSFFIYMMIQFMRGIPRDLDEAAYIDGCNVWQTLTKIIAPLCAPALFSAGIFQFMWLWNDFLNQLLYINSVKLYPISLALKMSLDAQSAVNWNQIMAMSVVSMIPPIIVYFVGQKYLVEGTTTAGLKG
ncbi:carbohydrate ABC transporter permease [Ruthenibacterium sp. TH_2024_36131]|uniref:carbohydrate ABC transporter permease n=1 Tax=Owariibacterium komagatae TaxID=3136601 RepID=UPI0038B256BB